MTKIETKEELKFLKSIEDWKFISLEKEELKDMKNLLNSAAKNTKEKLSKRKAINIRLLEDDILRLKAISIKKWIPYQTHITSIIHKYITWKLKDCT